MIDIFPSNKTNMTFDDNANLQFASQLYFFKSNSKNYTVFISKFLVNWNLLLPTKEKFLFFSKVGNRKQWMLACSSHSGRPILNSVFFQCHCMLQDPKEPMRLRVTSSEY